MLLLLLLVLALEVLAAAAGEGLSCNVDAVLPTLLRLRASLPLLLLLLLLSVLTPRPEGCKPEVSGLLSCRACCVAVVALLVRRAGTCWPGEVLLLLLTLEAHERTIERLDTS